MFYVKIKSLSLLKVISIRLLVILVKELLVKSLNVSKRVLEATTQSRLSEINKSLCYKVSWRPRFLRS